MTSKLDFLKSVRFYKLVATAIISILVSNGVLDKSIGDAFTLILLGSVSLATLDKVSANIGGK